MESLFIFALVLSAASANMFTQYLMNMASQGMDPATRSLFRSAMDHEQSDFEVMLSKLNRGSNSISTMFNAPASRRQGAGAPVSFSFPPSHDMLPSSQSQFNVIGPSSIKSPQATSAMGNAPLMPHVYSQNRIPSTSASGAASLLSSPAASVPTMTSGANMAPFPSPFGGSGFMGPAGISPMSRFPRFFYWRMLDNLFDLF